MRLISAILLFLILAALTGSAQNGSELNSGSPPLPPPITPSPLNGNWNIAGNRRSQQFPLVSMHIHVSGTQVIAHDVVEVRCPNEPRNGGGVRGGSLSGEIAPDGSFTLRNTGTSDTIQVEIRGQIPPGGAATWNGEYLLSGMASRKCPAYHETKSFTATPLAPLNATFSGSMTMKFFEAPPPTYTGPESYAAKFIITVSQGAVIAQRLKAGTVRYFLPLTATVRVHGTSCFSHGSADLATGSTHGTAPSPDSTIGGDSLVLRFAMNDESLLTVRAVFADPEESALVVSDARVAGGKCDKQSFVGTLDASKK